jgi:hypothetical protein
MSCSAIRRKVRYGFHIILTIKVGLSRKKLHGFTAQKTVDCVNVFVISRKSITCKRRWNRKLMEKYV